MRNELLNKVLKAIDGPIVGNYLFSDDELEEIYTTTYGLFHKISGLSTDEEAIVFVALVNLAKQWEFQGSLFDYLFRKFSSNEGFYTVIYDRIREVINSLINSKRIYKLDIGKYFYGTICSHALSPLKSTKAFFDLCWDIYCEDLRQQYVKHDPIFKALTHAIKIKFSGVKNPDNDSFFLSGSVYALKVGMIKLPVSSEKSFAWLLDETIGTMDAFLHERKVEADTYLKILIYEWWQAKIASYGLSKIKQSAFTNEEVAIDYSKIKIKYELIENKACLTIPPFRLLDDLDSKPKIFVKHHDKIVLEDSLNVFGSGIIMSSSPKHIPVECFLKEGDDIDFQLFLEHGGEIIHDTQDYLARDFVIFKDRREVVSNELVPGKYNFMCCNQRAVSCSARQNKTISSFVKEIYCFDGDEIQSPTKSVFFFFENTKRDVYIFANRLPGVVFRSGNAEYKVIDGDVRISISPKIDVNDIGVRYEETPLRLVDFPSKDYNGYDHYIITELLNVGTPQRISVFRYSDGKVLDTMDIIKFNNIRVSFDKDVYYGDDAFGVVSFDSNKYHEQTAFVSNNKEAIIKIDSGEIAIRIPKIEWKINENEWQNKPLAKSVWFEEIPEDATLLIRHPQGLECDVVLSDNQLPKKEGESGTYLLGLTIKKLKQSLSNNYLSLKIVKQEKKYHIMDIAFKEAFAFAPISLNGQLKTMNWLPDSYCGRKNASFQIVFESEKKIISSICVGLTPTKINLSKLPDDNYRIIVYPKENEVVNASSVLFEEQSTIGDERKVRFKNKELVLDEVVIMGNDIFRKKINPLYIDNVSFLGEKDGCLYYSGWIFYYREDESKRYFKVIKKTNGEIVTINPIRIEIKTNQTCYIGYGLDLTDEDFDYDNEFALNQCDYLSVETKINNIKTLPIDYFIFKIH